MDPAENRKPRSVSFLSLPPEIRAEVYAYHLAAIFKHKHKRVVFDRFSEPRTKEVSVLGHVGRSTGNLELSNNTAIFRVSRIVSAETRRLFYSQGDFISRDYRIHELYKFLHGIGKENRLFIQHLIISFELQMSRDGGFHSSGDNIDMSIYEYHLSGIFRMLSGAHNLGCLTLGFAPGSLDLFLQLEKVLQAFGTLRNIKKVQIKELKEDMITWERGGFSKDKIKLAELTLATRELIASVQRPSDSPAESKQQNPPFVDRAKSPNNRLSLLLDSRASFVTQKEALAKEIADHRAETVRAERRLLDLELSISEIERDIEKLVP